MLSAASGSVAGTTDEATRETLEPQPYPYDGDVAGRASVWYRWTAPTDGEYVWDTLGGGTDTLLAAYTAGPGGLARLASDDNAWTTTGSSRMRLTAFAGRTYYVTVDVSVYSQTGPFTLRWAPYAGSGERSVDLGPGADRRHRHADGNDRRRDARHARRA